MKYLGKLIDTESIRLEVNRVWGKDEWVVIA